jgi:hypothetical protein
MTAAAMAISLWGASAAGAAMVTVGNTSTFFPSMDSNNGSIVTYANLVLTENGDRVTSPVNGTIVQWHVTTAGTGQYVLRVLRPAGSQYIGAGSSPATVTIAGPNSFPASLPIQAGDLIGVDVPDQQGIAVGLVGGASYAAFIPPIAGTAVDPTFTNTDMDIALSADVQYPDPAPPANPGTTTTKKKCKKKHKRSASAAKKCKKKKK